MYESTGCTKVEGPKVEDRLYLNNLTNLLMIVLFVLIHKNN
jgi:hypothetical protein